VTVLAEIPAAGGWGRDGEELAALRRVLTRGVGGASRVDDPDFVSFGMFGLDNADPLPLAPVRRLGDLQREAADDAATDGRFWLQADPVTVRPGMSSLMVLGGGMARLTDGDALDLQGVVADTMADHGLRIEFTTRSRWYVPLNRAPEFRFLPPHLASGSNPSDLFSRHEEAARWRHVSNDIEMALHAHPVNTRLREAAEPPVNAVWFWGGGVLPSTRGQPPFDRCFSDDRLMRGLCRLTGVHWQGMGEWHGFGEHPAHDTAVVLDLRTAPTRGEAALTRLERILSELLGHVGHGVDRIDLLLGGRTCSLTRGRLRRFWMRDRSLSELLQPWPGECRAGVER
jgi:hypothetical protein